LASQPIHSFSASAKLDFRRWPEERLIARIRELSNDSLEGAIERGLILKTLNLAWHEYESKKVGISHHTAYRLIALVDHQRMHRDDWERPCQWTVCYELLQVTDKCFETMLASFPTTPPRIKSGILSEVGNVERKSKLLKSHP
jgi:hypothetical protein